MQNAVSGDFFLRSLKLFSSNPLIAVPFIAAFFINQTTQLLLHPLSPDATFLARVCASAVGVLAFSAAYTYTVGMMQAAWAHGSATFSDGRQATAASIDRIAVAVAALQLICLVPSVLVKQSSSGQDFFSAALASASMLLLILAVSLLVSYLLTYIGPSIVIGGKDAVSGFTQSAKIASQNIGTTFTITLATYGVFGLGFAFMSSGDFSHPQISGLLLYPLLFSLAVCFIMFLICGEYLAVYGFPASSLGITRQKQKHAAIPLAIAYIAISCATAVFCLNGFSIKTYSPSTYFSAKTGNISIDHLLQNFIIETHGVKTNRAVEKQAIDDAYAMVLPHSDAYAYLEAWFPTHDPFTLSRNEARFVYQLKMQPADRTNVYAITWHEAVIHPITNAVIRSEQWEAAIRIAPDAIPGKAFITQITWKRVR